MSLFDSILVPLDGSAVAAGSLGCATWLASQLGARLHILSATPRELPAEEELRRLKVPETHWPTIELHQAPTSPADAILAAIVHLGAGMVVMAARGADVERSVGPRADLTRLVGHVTQAVIERGAVPVLLLPPGYREVLPWESLLVPISGGTESDQAIILSVRLANALHLTVYVAHVADDASLDVDLAAQTRYSDALHHEYTAQLDELVARAIPELSPEECRCIHPIALGRGDVAGELNEIRRRERVSALVVGWHGQYASGRAKVLKRLIRIVDTPVVLVKAARAAPFRLKVGDELQ